MQGEQRSPCLSARGTLVNTGEQAEATLKVARIRGRLEHFSKHVKKPLAEFDSSQPYSQAEN